MVDETRRERFERIATNRTNRVIDTLRLLGNCSNKSNYEYSEEDVKKIFAAIEAETKTQKARFHTAVKPKKFKL